MNSESSSGSGLSNGRQWSALPLDGAPIEWSVDPQKGYVQGPLELEFMRGQKLSLVLTEGQQALLVHEGQLQAVYLDGAHYLEIGHGRRQINPACQLIFLALNEPLRLCWPRSEPLRWGSTADQAVIGSCALEIQWPSRFFGTFLQGQQHPDPEFIERLINQIVSGLFAEHLSGSPTGEGAPAASELQTRLTRITPSDLNEDLNACGLSCTHLAVYTAAPPIEDDMSQQSPRDVTVTY